MDNIALSIKELSKIYDNGHRAIESLSLEVSKNDFFALLGPNGAGKSTLIGIISSLIRKTKGEVKVYGIDIDKNFPRAKELIGVVPQEFNFNNFETVYNIPLSQAGYYGVPYPLAKQNTEKYLKLLNLWDKRHNKALTLSGGMRRRLMIVRALVHEPQLLILDEPTAGVDIELRRSTWELLRQLNEAGTTIVLTTHYLEEAESLCRNIAIIDSGKLIQSTSMKSLLSQLNKQTLIFDVAQTLPQQFDIPGATSRRIDTHSLEVDVGKEQPLNAVFEQFQKNNIQVISMRNKVNRLEEIVVGLLKGQSSQPSASEGQR